MTHRTRTILLGVALALTAFISNGCAFLAGGAAGAATGAAVAEEHEDAD